jgi:hypothetical protein
MMLRIAHGRTDQLLYCGRFEAVCERSSLGELKYPFIPDVLFPGTAGVSPARKREGLLPNPAGETPAVPGKSTAGKNGYFHVPAKSIRKLIHKQIKLAQL